MVGNRSLVSLGVLAVFASCDLPPYIPPYEEPEVIDTEADGTTTGCDIQPTLSDLYAKYFALSCVFGGCHEASSQEGGLDIEAEDLHGQLVNVPADDPKAGPRGKIRVIPFDPDSSFLVEKLEGRQARDEGNLMPDGTDVPIDPECRIKMVREWIANGALDD